METQSCKAESELKGRRPSRWEPEVLRCFQVLPQVWLSQDNRTSENRVWQQCPKAGSGGCPGHLVNGYQGQTGLSNQSIPHLFSGVQPGP